MNTLKSFKELEYPYRYYYSTEDDMQKAFKLVKRFRLAIVPTQYKINNMPELRHPTFDGISQLIECRPSDYDTMNWLSDWFNEDARIRCKRYDEPTSPFDYWTANKSKIVASSVKHASDIVYSNILGCNNFRPGLMRGMIEYTGANSVLDFSAGWGDRLIGSIAAGVRYVGVDPNDKVHVGYKKIIEVLGRNNPKYTVIEAPFQTAELPNETFDLVFTSPPYFNLEIYSDAPTQSVNEFNTLDTWFTGFLMKSVARCWEKLNPGGHLVVIINNIRGRPDFVLRMVEQVTKFTYATYRGVLPYADKIMKKPKSYYKSPQPMWIWRKDSPAFFDHERIIEVTSSLMDFTAKYPNLVTDKPQTYISHGEATLDGTVRNVYENTNIILNPPLVIEDLVYGNRVFKLIRDDLLPGGTKQRGCSIIEGIDEEEVVYAGPWNGFAQVALSIGCKIYGKTATVFMARDRYTTNVRARMYGCNIKVIPGASLKELQAAAKQYCIDNDAHLMPFGFDSADFKNAMLSSIQSVCPKDIREFNGTIWLVGGSTTLLNVLYKVFPDAKFHVVQVGKTIWEDQTEPERTKISIAPENFFDEAEIMPPYHSVPTYDAKAWRFIIDDALTGDMIWNVAGHT